MTKRERGGLIQEKRIDVIYRASETDKHGGKALKSFWLALYWSPQRDNSSFPGVCMAVKTHRLMQKLGKYRTFS